MSLDAMSWAWKQQAENSSQKLTLLSLADRAGEDHTCWPSIDRLSLDTGLNRKTVLKSLKGLVTLGIIRDTGERKGKTRQVRCYQLVGVSGRDDESKSTNVGSVSDNKSPKSGTVSEPRKSTKSGTVKESQKRNSSKNGTVPNLPAKSTNFGSGNSTNFGTQNQSLEPVSEHKDTSDPAGRTRDGDSAEGDPTDDASQADAESNETTVDDQDLEFVAIREGKRWGEREDLELATWMAERIDALLEQDAPPRRNIATWANDIRLMRQQDRRELRHIQALFWWAHQHHFWQANILSPSKLREQWSTLAGQRKRERESGHATRQRTHEPSGLDRQLTDPRYAVDNW